MIGSTISHYEITAELGRGGMGVVYKARDRRLDRDVALKFLADHLLRDSGSHDRFMQEAKATAALTHANICTLYDVGEEDGRLFLVMEYVDGRSLKDVLDTGPLEEGRARHLAHQVARGLARAHEQGIVHRDIKPANIMVTPRDEAKIMDFGLAKLTGGLDLTKTGSTLGTALYMSPEQARGEPLKSSSDVWSLGVVLYEMLLGKRPFDGRYEAAVIYNILDDEADLTEVDSSELRPLLERVLQKDKSSRPSAAEMATVLAGSTTVAERPSPTSRSRVRLAATVVGVSLVALLIGWQVTSREVPTSAPTSTRVAVIPFPDLSPGAEDNYLGEGVAESLISVISRMAGLNSPSLNSTRPFRGADAAVEAMGDALDAPYIIHGSIQKAGGRIRLTTYLTETDSNHDVWSNQLTAGLGEIFELQDTMADSIAAVLTRTLGVTSSTVGIERGTDNEEAYDFYIRGIYAQNNRNASHSVEMFDRALELDPEFVDAIVAKIWGYRARVGSGEAQATDELLATVKELADEVSRLAPGSAEEYAVQAIVSILDSDLETSLLYSKLAFQEDSLSVSSRTTYAKNLFFSGHILDAISVAGRTMKLEPTDYSPRFAYLLYTSHAGLFTEAEMAVEEGLLLIPNFPAFLMREAEIRILQGELEEALAILDGIAEVYTDPLVLYYLATTHGRMGNVDQVQERYDRMWALRADRNLPLTIFSALSWYLDEWEQAEAFIMQAIEERDPWLLNGPVAIVPVEVFSSEAWYRVEQVVIPGNPWSAAEYSEHGVILNPAEVQAAAEVRFPGMGLN